MYYTNITPDIVKWRGTQQCVVSVRMCLFVYCTRTESWTTDWKCFNKPWNGFNLFDRNSGIVVLEILISDTYSNTGWFTETKNQVMQQSNIIQFLCTAITKEKRKTLYLILEINSNIRKCIYTYLLKLVSYIVNASNFIMIEFWFNLIQKYSWRL